MTVTITPWAGDNPYIFLNVGNMQISMQATKRSFWVYFNVQTIPSKEYEDLRYVAKAAEWSFVIDTGVEQLICSNTVSYNVKKKLKNALLSYRHKDRNIAQWSIPISKKEAIQLSADLRERLSDYDKKYLVKTQTQRVFKSFGSVLESTGDMYKYRFSFGK